MPKDEMPKIGLSESLVVCAALRLIQRMLDDKTLQAKIASIEVHGWFGQVQIWLMSGDTVPEKVLERVLHFLPQITCVIDDGIQFLRGKRHAMLEEERMQLLVVRQVLLHAFGYPYLARREIC